MATINCVVSFRWWITNVMWFFRFTWVSVGFVSPWDSIVSVGKGGPSDEFVDFASVDNNNMKQAMEHELKYLMYICVLLLVISNCHEETRPLCCLLDAIFYITSALVVYRDHLYFGVTFDQLAVQLGLYLPCAIMLIVLAFIPSRREKESTESDGHLSTPLSTPYILTNLTN